ncbi:GNAT family N-acetyltransferase [Candidatus Bipolaricaulota bacterium]|nr:GNAT family N-acetyltransferase [Candidatus Bipolaricaulota bacterium]
MIRIRPYCEIKDARTVGLLIADTFRAYNLAHLNRVGQLEMLGPFRHAKSRDAVHEEAIREAIRSEIVLVAEQARGVIGVLRGRPTQLGSLFVRGEDHRHGVGRALVERFEAEVRRQHGTILRVAATLPAVPFYQAMGYKRFTGVQTMRVFDGAGFEYQPMRKFLSRPGACRMLEV